MIYVTQTELLFAQSLRSPCSVYVDTPRVILLVTVFFIIQPEANQQCERFQALVVLMSGFTNYK